MEVTNASNARRIRRAHALEIEATIVDAPDAPRAWETPSAYRRRIMASVPVVADHDCVVLISSGEFSVATEQSEIDAICDREIAALAPT